MIDLCSSLGILLLLSFQLHQNKERRAILHALYAFYLLDKVMENLLKSNGARLSYLGIMSSGTMNYDTSP